MMGPVRHAAVATQRRCVFVDRDGVLIENRDPYVLSCGDVHFIEGAETAIKELDKAGYHIVIVTNQAAVAKGLISLKQAKVIQRHTIGTFEQLTNVKMSWYLCPHAVGDRCRCRKPQVGMLLAASEQLGIDLKRSYLIGDAITDAIAAVDAGVTPFFVLTGRGRVQYDTRPTSLAEVDAFNSILEAANYIAENPIP
jgi:D-glycero-D-manno-heptose 1,7-bisphosphate phosphatase